MNNTHIKIENIHKRYNKDFNALNCINLDIKRGEILVLLGPSGCGKSTLLRIIGGLENSTSGKLIVDGKDYTNILPEKRNIGFVFQQYALFPTMTVRENIGFGLKIRKIDKVEIEKRVDELVSLINLKDHENKYPHQLSGGQQQRVALGRALAINPDIILLDEPLTALDAKLKEHLQMELSILLRKLNITTVFVTHDQHEAMLLADRIVVMSEGNIEQIGTAKELYENPKSHFVTKFIGKTNEFDGRVEHKENKVVLDFDLGKVEISHNDERFFKLLNKDVKVYLRPEDCEVYIGKDESKRQNYFKVDVVKGNYLGSNSQYIVNHKNHNIVITTDKQINYKEDDTYISFDLQNLIILERERQHA